ncbi:group II intron reverse transcriptase/maturase [Amycolatopsis taiwanensis]|uniref:RNA-directed DNA polymerase n=1 Tax=Amycolatopsis taiwanensis TaxID=342230 RepID=A0A9W6RD35_9PSEU|nr:group II intron reverse transcriptase/maturase [Amycolatopsis taiwanensis]GLY71725.1 group II intron reverse transcriptase/maturase [Amycolatopsis taiwanensis]
MNGSRSDGKSFGIEKMQVWEAYQKVRNNKGAAGVDGVSLGKFEADLKNNLYKVWNRMSSGTYFPPPVMAVEIPKKDGGVRVLGVPTVADRVAQTTAAMVLEEAVEPLFHADSFGYRPGRSALDAVRVCRDRCWRKTWVIDLDITAFFDTVPHDRIIQAVERHTDQRWVLLYVKRWLSAPMQRQNETLVTRDRGTPQGSAISPVLANLFMHYAFDRWISREFPMVEFERYCDDVVVHCVTEGQAKQVLEAIIARLTTFGLQVHPDKTRIVYCKDQQRGGDYPTTEFTFLGYTFRARGVKRKDGRMITRVMPAASKQAKKAMAATIRSWGLGRRANLNWKELAARINPVIAGWVNYYGHFYGFELYETLRRVNEHLARWLIRKYKRLRRSYRKAFALLYKVSQTYPGMFRHWRWGAKPHPIGQ